MEEIRPSMGRIPHNQIITLRFSLFSYFFRNRSEKRFFFGMEMVLQEESGWIIQTVAMKKIMEFQENNILSGPLFL